MNLSFIYKKGEGVQNLENTIAKFKKYVEKGDPAAMFNLALCCQNGYGLKKNLRRAFELYEESARLGNKFSAFNLALCFEKGEGVAKDMSKAIECYHYAA